MILYTVYNCDDQITGISNYIPTNLPSACRVEPINLDIDYPGLYGLWILSNVNYGRACSCRVSSVYEACIFC